MDKWITPIWDNMEGDGILVQSVGVGVLLGISKNANKCLVISNPHNGRYEDFSEVKR